MYKRKFYVSTIILFVVLLTTIVFSIFRYNTILDRNLYDAASKSLDEVIDQQINSLNLDISSDLNLLKNYAYVIGRSDKNIENEIKFLSETIANTNFDALIISDIYGNGITNQGEIIDISSISLSQEISIEKPGAGRPLVYNHDGNIVIPLSSPIYNNDNQLTGQIIGIYTTNRLKTLILPTFDGQGRTHVLDSNGKIITTNLSNFGVGDQSIYDFIDLDFLENNQDIISDIYYNVSQLQGSSFITNLNGKQVYVQYEPLGINDWFLVMVVESAVIADNANAIRQSTFIFIAIILACFVGYFIYISYILKKHNDELYHLAYYDNLTHLPNMQKFKECTKEVLENNKNQEYSCIIFDLSNFKYINDRYGYDSGNKVLIVIADSLRAHIKNMPKDTCCISRIYADTFAILLPATDNAMIPTIDKNPLGDKIDFLGDYKFAFIIGRYNCIFGEDSDDIFEKATIAHMKAQSLAPNQIVDYEDKLRENIKLKIRIRNKMEHALVNNEFLVYLQPKVDFKTEKICSCEALVRWNSEGEMLSPAVFINELERNGLIVELDFYVFKKVCQILNQWLDHHKVVVPIAVNFSRRHLSDAKFADKLYAILRKYDLPSNYIIIEFTENATIENQTAMKMTIENLHAFGFKVSMDDFGSGYSSFGSLDEICVDELKLDMNLIRNIEFNRRSKSIVHSIILMAKALGIEVVAEGIETEEQVKILRSMNCDRAQGYYFYRPVIYSEIEAILDDKRKKSVI